MSVTFNEEKKIFRLDTVKSTYVMGVSPESVLGHIYYRDRLFMEAAAVYTIGKQKREIRIP